MKNKSKEKDDDSQAKDRVSALLSILGDDDSNVQRDEEPASSGAVAHARSRINSVGSTSSEQAPFADYLSCHLRVGKPASTAGMAPARPKPTTTPPTSPPPSPPPDSRDHMDWSDRSVSPTPSDLPSTLAVYERCARVALKARQDLRRAIESMKQGNGPGSANLCAWTLKREMAITATVNRKREMAAVVRGLEMHLSRNIRELVKLLVIHVNIYDRASPEAITRAFANDSEEKELRRALEAGSQVEYMWHVMAWPVPGNVTKAVLPTGEKPQWMGKKPDDTWLGTLEVARRLQCVLGMQPFVRRVYSALLRRAIVIDPARGGADDFTRAGDSARWLWVLLGGAYTTRSLSIAGRIDTDGPPGMLVWYYMACSLISFPDVVDARKKLINTAVAMHEAGTTDTPEYFALETAAKTLLQALSDTERNAEYDIGSLRSLLQCFNMLAEISKVANLQANGSKDPGAKQRAEEAAKSMQNVGYHVYRLAFADAEDRDEVVDHARKLDKFVRQTLASDDVSLEQQEERFENLFMRKARVPETRRTNGAPVAPPGPSRTQPRQLGTSAATPSASAPPAPPAPRVNDALRPRRASVPPPADVLDDPDPSEPYLCLDGALREYLTTAVDGDGVPFGFNPIDLAPDGDPKEDFVERTKQLVARLTGGGWKDVTERSAKFQAFLSDMVDYFEDMSDAFAEVSGVSAGIITNLAGKRMWRKDVEVVPRAFNIFERWLVNPSKSTYKKNRWRRLTYPESPDCRMRRRWDGMFPPIHADLVANTKVYFERFKSQFRPQEAYKIYLNKYHHMYPLDGNTPTDVGTIGDFQALVKRIQRQTEYLEAVHKVHSTTILALERMDLRDNEATSALVSTKLGGSFWPAHAHFTSSEMCKLFNAHVHGGGGSEYARVRLRQYGLQPIDIAREDVRDGLLAVTKNRPGHVAADLAMEYMRTLVASGAAVESTVSIDIPPGYWCSPTYVGEAGESKIINLLIKIPDNTTPANPDEHNYNDVCDGFVPANLAPYWADIFKGRWKKPPKGKELQTADGVDVLVKDKLMLAYVDWRCLFWPLEASRGRPAVGSKGGECYNASWLIRRTAKLQDTYTATPEVAALLERFPSSPATEGRAPSMRARREQQILKKETPEPPHIIAISAPIPAHTPGVPRVFWGTVRIQWSSAVTTGFPTALLKRLTTTLPSSVNTMPFEQYVRAYDPLAPVKPMKASAGHSHLANEPASDSDSFRSRTPAVPPPKRAVAPDAARTRVRQPAAKRSVIEVLSSDGEDVAPKRSPPRKRRKAGVIDDDAEDDADFIPADAVVPAQKPKSEAMGLQVTDAEADATPPPSTPKRIVRRRSTRLSTVGEVNDDEDELEDDTPAPRTTPRPPRKRGLKPSFPARPLAPDRPTEERPRHVYQYIRDSQALHFSKNVLARSAFYRLTEKETQSFKRQIKDMEFKIKGHIEYFKSHGMNPDPEVPLEDVMPPFPPLTGSDLTAANDDHSDVVQSASKPPVSRKTASGSTAAAAAKGASSSAVSGASNGTDNDKPPAVGTSAAAPMTAAAPESKPDASPLPPPVPKTNGFRSVVLSPGPDSNRLGSVAAPTGPNANGGSSSALLLVPKANGSVVASPEPETNGGGSMVPSRPPTANGAGSVAAQKRPQGTDTDVGASAAKKQKTDDISFSIRQERVTLPAHVCSPATADLIKNAATWLARKRVPPANTVNALNSVFEAMEQPPVWLVRRMAVTFSETEERLSYLANTYFQVDRRQRIFPMFIPPMVETLYLDHLERAYRPYPTAERFSYLASHVHIRHLSAAVCMELEPPSERHILSRYWRDAGEMGFEEDDILTRALAPAVDLLRAVRKMPSLACARIFFPNVGVVERLLELYNAYDPKSACAPDPIIDLVVQDFGATGYATAVQEDMYGRASLWTIGRKIVV
ncbi:hypothetical protein EXIGLDRAFT_702713 [Exidia glandulosa HHB12029]|uniref:Uncharacterized protein n=1 Tax=Exidia glandulosa HHB12029 TaxID=1314781 RepID=A0A165LG59_EXIGL|nr:hypothetical protein EXIGLDRAFT_702713 [Exidia glandulosa HHB12029]